LQLTNFSPYGPGVDDQAIENLNKWAGCILPANYLKFLQSFNGGDTDPDRPAYFRIWSLDEVIEYNESYNIVTEKPELLAIGDDGGPSMYLVSKTTGEVFRYPYTLDAYYAEKLADSFESFLQFIENT